MLSTHQTMFQTQILPEVVIRVGQRFATKSAETTQTTKTSITTTW